MTGMGVVTPVGNDVQSFWSALCAGRSGIDTITAFDPSGFSSRIGGEVKDFDPTTVVDTKEAKRSDRFILLAMAAAREVMADCGIDRGSVDLNRFATVIASGIGGIRTLEIQNAKLLSRGPGRVSPFLIPMMITDMASGRVSIEYGLKGPNYSVVSACASASHAIGDGMIMLKAGMADMALVGGAEAAISPCGLAGFCSMKALSTRNDTPQKASSPFDRKRDGFVIGEGAGLVVIETLEHARARGAERIYAELVGYGATGDAHHISAPAPEGEGAQRSMRMALDMAGIDAESIDYINAHGTSTPFNDKNESKAIAVVFGEHANSVAISSTKSMTGHLLGASGGIEFVASVMAIQKGMIPPTINYEDPDPECPLSYTPNEAVERTVNYAMSNSFGFGGHNATLIVKKYETSETGS